MHKLVTIFASALAALALSADSLAESTFALEYHIVLTIDDIQYQAKNNVQVHDGHIASIELQQYRVDLEVSSRDSSLFQIIVVLFQRTDGIWVKMEEDPGGFGGSVGSFHSFSWNGEYARLNMATTVTMVEQC